MQKVLLTGYTPYPLHKGDTRLPHLAHKLARQINKTALDAENTIAWEHYEDIATALAELKRAGFTIAAVEQTPTSQPLPDFHPPEKIALLMGREVEGVEPEVLATCDMAVEIPMFGRKESFNVVQAAAMALYHCRFQ